MLPGLHFLPYWLGSPARVMEAHPRAPAVRTSPITQKYLLEVVEAHSADTFQMS